MKYVNKQLLLAKRQVDDLSWSDPSIETFERKSSQQTDDDYAHVTTKVLEKVPYREIFIFSRKHRKDKLKEHIRKKNPNYSCAYFKNGQDNNHQIPLLNFMIIDDEVIVLGDEYNKSKFSVKNPIIVGLFKGYYEKIWNNAIKIKEGSNLHQEVIDEILNS